MGKYMLNEGSFDLISPESAYWVGFLMADGCILKSSGKNAKLKVALQTKDKVHLTKMLKFLESDSPIFSYTENSVECYVFSERLCNRLAELGVVPRKSLIAEAMPELVLDKDFWRGIIDGDGHIGLQSNGSFKKQPSVELACSHNITRQFKEFVQHHVPAFKKKIYDRGNYSALKVVGSKQAVTILNVLYGDNPTYYLDRKMEKALQFVSA